jgi:hypothetical protein
MGERLTDVIKAAAEKMLLMAQLVRMGLSIWVPESHWMPPLCGESMSQRTEVLVSFYSPNGPLAEPMSPSVRKERLKPMLRERSISEVPATRLRFCE